MFDINQLDDGKTITVTPAKRLFEELKNKNNNFESLLAELINNSIASTLNGKVKVAIKIYLSDKNPEKNYMIIKDNGSGMNLNILTKSISPAKKAGKHELNDHGLGNNQSIPALGDLLYLATKTKNNDEAIFIDKFKFGEIKTQKGKVDFKHGTEICIVNLNQGKDENEDNIVYSDQTSYTRFLIKQLGARYRRFLDPNDPKLDLSIKLFNIDKDSSIKKTWNIKQTKQIFMDLEKGENVPREKNVLFQGKNWKAKLTYGYSAQDKDYKTLGLEEPTSDHPYFTNQSHQGFDLIIHDVVIKRSQLSEINLVSQKHPRFNYIRGEINLIEGFKTNTTKDNILRDKNFRELINKLQKYLTDNKYLKPIPRDIREKVYVDRFYKKLKTHPILSKKNIIREYTVKTINARFDIYLDGEVYEFKTGKAKWKHVYELLGYLHNSELNKGFLVAESADDKVLLCMKKIKKFGYDIQFLSFRDLNIDGNYTKEERKQLFIKLQVT